MHGAMRAWLQVTPVPLQPRQISRDVSASKPRNAAEAMLMRTSELPIGELIRLAT